MSDDKLPKGRGGHPNRDRQPLRRPGVGDRAGTNKVDQNEPGTVNEVSGSNVETNPNWTNSFRSSLSPMAEVFVPRNAQTTYTDPTNSNPYAAPSAVAPPPVENGEIDDISLSHVRTIMYEITMNPGKFDYLASMLVDALNVTIRSEPTLRMIVDEIFEQSVTESNFRYNGSRLCNCLSQNLTVTFNHNGFRTYLLQRCQQEFAKKDVLLEDLEGQARLRGFTMLLGELFIHLEIFVNGRHLKVKLLGDTVMKLLDALLSIPSKDNLKCVCQMLKFTGAAVEDQERENNGGEVNAMNMLFVKMRQLLPSTTIDRNSSDLLVNVIDLRASNWGRSSSSGGSQEESYVPNEAQGTEPVLYGPDGLPISSEEALFLESNQYLYDPSSAEDECNDDNYYGQPPSLWSTTSDDMDDEMVAEFEKFLLENS